MSIHIHFIVRKMAFLFLIALVSCGDHLASQKPEVIRPPETKLGVAKGFKIKCNVSLNSADKVQNLNNESESFTIEDFADTESKVEISFADYTLISAFKNADSFCAVLYRGSDIESESCHSGLTADVALPLTALGNQPSDFSFGGEQIQQIEYRCLLSDIGVQ